jgi:surface antigen
MAAARLWRARASTPLFAVVLVAALGAGGCSFSYKLGGLIGKEDVKTGSAAPAKASDQNSPADLPPDSDLVFARAAVHEVLARGGEDTSLPWENPASGARGTITPLTSAYSHDGFLCRDFLASYVREGSEAWLQGEACRLHQGKWEVKNLRSWKRT